MKKSQSFPHLVDEIVGGLVFAAQIEIGIETLSTCRKGANSLIKVTGVNGYSTPRRYCNYLQDLRVTSMTRLREIIPHINPAETEIFFGILLREVRRLLSSVRTIKEEELTPASRALFTLSHVHCFCKGEESQEAAIRGEAILQTQRFALIYYLVLSKLEEHLTAACGASIVLPPPMPAAEETEPPITANCVIPYIGALLRVFLDKEFITVKSVASLCLFISKNIRTKDQSHISAGRLRKLIDNPSIRHLEQVQMDIRTYDKYIDRLIILERI